jgi:hypothetical protein
MADAHGSASPRTVRVAIAVFAWLALLLGAGAAGAQPAPESSGPVPQLPEIAGRVVPLRGQVGVTLPGDPAPTPADNRPLVGGERIETAADARALIQLGSTALRLGPRADLELRALAAPGVSIELRAGSAALQIATQDWADRIVILTPEGQWRALRPGHYRIDRWADATRGTAWEGDLRFDAADRTLVVPAGRFAEVSRPGGQGRTEVAWGEPVPDEFAQWVQRDAQAAAQAAALRHVSPEVVGWEDLDRHGDWINDPEWGSLWLPSGVGAGWTPYLDGRWVWVGSWGWTWVDASPWGFAPFHYGRWLRWHDRWAWAPGPRHAPPRFSPAPPQWTAPPRSPPAPRPHLPPPTLQLPDRPLPHPPDRAIPHPPAAAPEPPRTGRPVHPPAPPAVPSAPHDSASPGSGEREHRRHREPTPDGTHRPGAMPPGASVPTPVPPRREAPVEPTAPGAPSPHRPLPPGQAQPRPPTAPVQGGQGAAPAAPGGHAPQAPTAPRPRPGAPTPAPGAPAEPGRAPPPGVRHGALGDRPAAPPAEPARQRPAGPSGDAPVGPPPSGGGGPARPAMR